MDLSGTSDIDKALQRVGQLLAYEGHSYAIVILGGAALNLLGIVERPTTDVDILAFATLEQGRPGALREPPEPMPEPLRHAVREVARDMGLEEDWLNAAPALRPRLLQALRGSRLDGAEEYPLSRSPRAGAHGG